MRDRKVDVFRSLRLFKPSDVPSHAVCAQYTAGKVDGRSARGYLQEKNVARDSRIPTFAAVRFELDNWRWRDVPIFVMSGKRMAERRVEISIQFKHVPTSIFKPLAPDQLCPNVLKFRIQPDEAISMRFEAKHPGPKLCLGTVNMDFLYREAFKTPPPESYVRLFLDAMVGDQTLFSRSDEVEACWRVIDPIIHHWESPSAPPLPTYPAGTPGPQEAQTLLGDINRRWH